MRRNISTVELIAYLLRSTCCETTKFDTWQILKYQKTKNVSFFVFNKYLHDIVHLH